MVLICMNIYEFQLHSDAIQKSVPYYKKDLHMLAWYSMSGWTLSLFIYVVIAHVVLGAAGEPCASCMDVHFNDLGLIDSFYVSLI